MGDGTEPVAQGLGVNRGHLVQQLLEERRQRLEEKLAATATAVPLIASFLAVDGGLPGLLQFRISGKEFVKESLKI